MLVWAMGMRWKGAHPTIKLNPLIYKKGITLTKQQMEPIEARLERHPDLPKWDILESTKNRGVRFVPVRKAEKLIRQGF